MTSQEQASLVGLGGKLVESLRSSPLVLAVIVLNVIMLASIFWSVRDQRHLDFELAQVDQRLEAEMLRLLSECQRSP